MSLTRPPKRCLILLNTSQSYQGAACILNVSDKTCRAICSCLLAALEFVCLQIAAPKTMSLARPPWRCLILFKHHSYHGAACTPSLLVDRLSLSESRAMFNLSLGSRNCIYRAASNTFSTTSSPAPQGTAWFSGQSIVGCPHTASCLFDMLLASMQGILMSGIAMQVLCIHTVCPHQFHPGWPKLE